jgi:hypothetical protein
LSADDHKSPHLAHVPEHCLSGLAVANADKPLAQLQGDTSGILERLKTERAVDIAQSLGVSHVALYAWLLKHCPEEWKAISAGKALARIEQAEMDMDAAKDQVAISKARESHRMGAWAAERVCRPIYGDTKQGNGDITVQVLIQRDGESLQANVIEKAA